MKRVIALGESVLDIIFKEDVPQAARPGGSSFNSIISLGRAGLPAYFISDLGHDRVGRMILDFMEENGVDSRYVVRYEGSKSALSLAFLNERNDAEYEFYKDYPRQRLGNSIPTLGVDDILLFGSFYALNPVLRPRVASILSQSGEAGSLIIYDPNFRSSHLDDLDQLKGLIIENMQFASLVRCSDEDLRNVFGTTGIEDSWSMVSPYCPILIYTANAHGVWLKTPEISFYVEVPPIIPVSTIGAGDSFNAGLIYGLYRMGYGKDDLASVSANVWEKLIRQAISFSSGVCMSYDNYISREFADMLINNPDV